MHRTHHYRVGERVICRVCKRSTHPGPRAQGIRPEPSGEGYLYEVEKCSIVVGVNQRQLVLLTRKGKTRVVDANDISLRPAGLLERFFYRDRFPDGPLIDAALHQDIPAFLTH